VLEARDGSRRPVEDSGAPIRDATGAVMGVVLVFRDVTNARAAENALVESEARYRELFENSPAGIYRTTPEGRILLANPALLRMLRYSSFAEMAGRNLEENGYGPGHSRAEFKRIIEQQGEIRDFEAAWVRRDGTLVLVRENAKAIRDASGATVYYDGIAEDITDRRRAEEERARLQLQLVQAQKMETIGRLAGGVAHDFNNLLTVINGYSALALSRLQRGDRQFHEFTEILRAGERAAGLVRQLLAFGRKQVLQPEVLDLNATVGNMEEMLRRLVSEEIEMVVRLDPAVAPVLADRHQIEQVVMNLAVNARDAMPSGGTMTLETGERHREGVCKRCHEQIRPGTYVLLTVRDTGMGMDAHTLEHLFEPFFTTKEVGKGTGLGLSTVQGIVIQSGGHVDVESEVDKGSAFHVYLPVAERSTVEPSALPPADVIKGGAETILLVEDQQTVREFVATILEGYGYRVVQAQDAAQALRVCAGQPVDLLVTDVAMPKMSGVELARRLRLTLPGLRTIFISGYSEDTHAQQRKSLPGAGFLQKPFSPQDLAQKVREVLEGR
jgi:PAS domain S-box-containing protein